MCWYILQVDGRVLATECGKRLRLTEGGSRTKWTWEVNALPDFFAKIVAIVGGWFVSVR